MSELTPGFIVAHSHRLEELTDLAVELTRNYPLAPLSTETLLVQSNGIAQWLKINLAQAAGIAAMLDVTLPARFQWHAYRAVLGEQLPKTSPFDKDRLTWRILRILPELLQCPEFSALQSYMGDSDDPQKSFQLAERLADLFDQYQIYRADWLADWQLGKDTAANAEQSWQPILWRALLADVGDQMWNNRAQLHRQFIKKAQQLTPQTKPAKLPERVIIFGISSLPEQLLEVLDALKGCMQIVLCVQNPCQYHWADIVDDRDLLRIYERYERRQAYKQGMSAELDDEQLHAKAHPLLAAWGKQGRDYIRLLDKFDETQAKGEHFNTLNFDLFTELEPQSVLQQLQNDILQLNSLAEIQAEHREWRQDDHSIMIHSCHSIQREVEVLHDHLLAALAEDPELEPRDVMVMVPDIDLYAAHIEAVFGRYERDDPRHIPFSLADQAQRQQPLLLALEFLLSLPQQRLRASDVFDLLQVPALAERFRISAGQLPQLQQWISEAEIRWGLDAAHREQLGLPAAEGRNSWLFGLQRMLFGYAVGREAEVGLLPEWQHTVAYPEVAGLEAEAAGALAEFIHRLQNWQRRLQQQYDAASWRVTLEQLLADFFAPAEDSDELLLQRLQHHLQQWHEAIDAGEFVQPLSLQVVRESWLQRMEQSSLQQRFLAGRVNFATLMPMRAIPFKHICILGLNDGDYPRTQKPLDFDLMAHDYRPGDRSHREDDRYLFLEALLSARQRLYLSWCGRSIRDNTEQPPSVLLSQLFEHLKQGWEGAKERIIEHPLQAFSRRYFEQVKPQFGQLFTYAAEWQALHQQGELAKVQALAPWQAPQALSLNDVRQFLEEPARLFFKLRFGLNLSYYQQHSADDELQAPSGLDSWQLLDRVLAHLQAQLEQLDATTTKQLQIDAQMNRYLAQLSAAGSIPAGAAGQLLATDLCRPAEFIMCNYQSCFLKYPQALEPQRLSYQRNGLELEETIHGLRRTATGQLAAIFCSASKALSSSRGKRTKFKHWFRPLLQHLLCNTVEACETQVLSQDGCWLLQPISAEQAKEVLDGLLEQVEQGLCEPLPVTFEWCDEDWQKGTFGLVQNAESGFMSETNTPHFSRCFGSFEQLDQDLFNATANTLYQPLAECLRSCLEENQAQFTSTEAEA